MRIRKRTFYLLTLWAIRVTIIVSLFVGYYTYYWTDVFTIKTYDIQGVDTERIAMIQVQLSALAQGTHLLVLPNDKIFTYSNSGIISVVRANVPETKTITMRPVGLHTVRIEITMLSPSARLPDGKALTSDGIIFSTKRNLSSYPTVVLASSTEETIKMDGLPFSRAVWKNMSIDNGFLEPLLSMSGKVSSVVFPVTTILVEEEGDVTLSNASGTSHVFFLRDTDTKKVWSTLVSAIDTDPLKNKLETNKKGLMYLDVRYGNKVFYRFDDMAFQNNGLTAILETSVSSTSQNATTTTTDIR
jgi:hypothetical protein